MVMEGRVSRGLVTELCGFPGEILYELEGFPVGAFFFGGELSGFEIGVLDFGYQIQGVIFYGINLKKSLLLRPVILKPDR
jgi:hypothetical protein